MAQQQQPKKQGPTQRVVLGVTIPVIILINLAFDLGFIPAVLIGAVIGAQVGIRVGARLRGEELRALLALMVLGVCARLAWGLVAEPADPFSIAPLLEAAS